MSSKFFLIGFSSSLLYSALVHYCFRQFCLETNIDVQHFKRIKIPVRYDELMAENLFEKVKIVCIVMTISMNHRTKADHVRDTWGKRCNKIIFMTDVHDPALGSTVTLNVGENHNTLWRKTRAAFQYVHANHLKDADWFLKADDDTLGEID